MQTLSLLPRAYSRAMVVDTSSRMGWRKGSPLNFFQVIKLVLMNSTEKNATEREFKVKILLFRPISQIARVTQSRHNIRLAGEFAVYVANPQVGIREESLYMGDAFLAGNCRHDDQRFDVEVVKQLFAGEHHGPARGEHRVYQDDDTVVEVHRAYIFFPDFECTAFL